MHRSTEYAPLPPHPWMRQLQDFDLDPELHHLALSLAQIADETGRVRVYLDPLARRTGVEPERASKLIAKLKRLGLLRLLRRPDGRGHPALWQLVEAA
jgi:hypothetical protein